MRKVTLLLAIPLVILGFAGIQRPKVIQIDVSHILNARPVTVLYSGRLITWTKGIDGGGAGDGYLTMSAALFNGDKAPHALPDNAVFPANESHPEIVLHYSNNDTTTNQTLNVAGEGAFECSVPAHTYTGLFVCLTSSEGPSQLQFELVYADGSTTQIFLLPDYYDDLKPGDPGITYVAHDLAKWNNKNKMAETDHHNIDVVNLHPDSKRILKAVKVKKAKAGYLVFWGAAGTMNE